MEEVICIIDDGCYLTTGKSYKVQWRGNGWITVVNDYGRISEYPESYFKSY